MGYAISQLQKEKGMNIYVFQKGKRRQRYVFGFKPYKWIVACFMKVLKYYKGKCGNAARVRNTKGLQLELKIGLWLELEMGLQMKWDE